MLSGPIDTASFNSTGYRSGFAQSTLKEKIEFTRTGAQLFEKRKTMNSQQNMGSFYKSTTRFNRKITPRSANKYHSRDISDSNIFGKQNKSTNSFPF